VPLTGSFHRVRGLVLHHSWSALTPWLLLGIIYFVLAKCPGQDSSIEIKIYRQTYQHTYKLTDVLQSNQKIRQNIYKPMYLPPSHPAFFKKPPMGPCHEVSSLFAVCSRQREQRTWKPWFVPLELKIIQNPVNEGYEALNSSDGGSSRGKTEVEEQSCKQEYTNILATYGQGGPSNMLV